MAERQCWKCKTWHQHLTEQPKLRCECGAWMGAGGRGATRDQQAKVEMDLLDLQCPIDTTVHKEKT